MTEFEKELEKLRVVAEPKFIDPMEPKYFDTKEENHKTYTNALTWPVLEHPYKGADLVFKGNKYLVLDHELKQVVYLMRWTTREVLSRQAAYQVIVWSDPAVNEIRGYAPKVFFGHLFAKNKLICTDRLQTPGGKRFWISAITSAIKAGLNVYYLDMNRQPRVYAHIGSMTKFEEYDNQGLIWSKENKGKGQLLLISEEQIPQFHKA